MNPKIQWIVDNKVFALSVLSCIAFGYHAANQSIRQAALEANIIELRQQQQHANETDFALRLSGMRTTATQTENAMLTQYEKNLQLIEHCKKVKTCQLPPTLAVVTPLPNYVPIAGIYLQEKEKLIQESNH